METGVFNIDEARRQRDIGMSRVSNTTWREKYRQTILMLPDGFTGIAESFHAEMRLLGLEEPHHHNAWGANFRAMKDSGVVIETGRHAQMQKIRSHGRKHCPIMQLVKSVA